MYDNAFLKKSMSLLVQIISFKSERGKLSFTEECKLIFVERRTELENHHIVNTKVIIIDSGKNYQSMLKPLGKRLLGNRISP